MSTEDEVRDLVMRFVRAYEQRDLTAAGELFARDDTLLFYGTQRNLHFVGWPAIEASFRRQFEVLEGISIGLDPDAILVRILAGGGAACVAIQALRYRARTGERTLDIPNIRVTGTLEQREDRWRFVQMHWSLPDGEILVQHD